MPPDSSDDELYEYDLERSRPLAGPVRTVLTAIFMALLAGVFLFATITLLS